MTVRLTQIARNGMVCHTGSSRIATRLIATKATQAMSTHDERVQVRACPDHPEASWCSRPARLVMAAATGCGARRTKRWTDTSSPNLAARRPEGLLRQSCSHLQTIDSHSEKAAKRDLHAIRRPRWRHAPGCLVQGQGTGMGGVGAANPEH